MSDYERIEIALRSVLDDDEAADLTLMLKEEPETVMWVLYEQWPKRHADAATDNPALWAGRMTSPNANIRGHSEAPPYNPDLELITWMENYGYGPTRPLPRGWRRLIYEARAVLGW
jgi:hypothetical protein